MTPLEKRRRRVPNAKCQCQHPSSSSFVGAGGRKEKGRLSKFEQNEHSRFPSQPIPLLACSSTFLLIPFVRYSVVSGEEDGGDGSYGRQSQSQNEEEEEKRRREKINMTDRTGKGKKVFASCITTQTERKCEPFLPLFFFFFPLLLVPKHDLTVRNGEEDFLPLSSSCRYERQKRGWLVSSFISRFRRVLTSSLA